MVLHGSLLPSQAVQECLATHSAAPDAHVDITTDPAAAAAAAGGASAASYGKAVVLCSHADAAVLGAVAKLLAPGASVAVQLHKEQVRACVVDAFCHRRCSVFTTDVR